MFMSKLDFVSAMSFFVALSFAAEAQQIGRNISEEDIAPWDISVPPDGSTLPPGSGDIATGGDLYSVQCAFCHGETGEEGPADRLVGGIGTLSSDAPIKTVGSFWPHATTLFDYIRRAMPYHSPGSLNNDEAYAVTAYLLYLNGILEEDVTLDADSLREVVMPNSGGFLARYPMVTKN